MPIPQWLLNRVKKDRSVAEQITPIGGKKYSNGYYTGNGPDGRTQRNKPTNIMPINGQESFIHEDEFVSDDGKNVISSDRLRKIGGPAVANKLIGANQKELMDMEQRNPKMPGYADGTISPKLAAQMRGIGDISDPQSSPVTPIVLNANDYNRPGSNSKLDARMRSVGDTGTGAGNMTTGIFNPITAKSKMPPSEQQSPTLPGPSITQKQTTGMMSDIATGKSPIFDKIANKSLQNLDTRLQTTNTLQKMNQSVNPNLTEGAKRTFDARAAQNAGAAQSGLIGDLATNAMNMSTKALMDAHNMASADTQAEISKILQDRSIASQDYTALYSQYEDAIENGNIDQAKAIWGQMKGNEAFSPWMPAIDPNFEKLGQDYNKEQVKDLKGEIGNLFAEFPPPGNEVLDPIVTDILEAQYGKSIAEIAQEQGLTEQQVIDAERERLRDTSSTGIDRLLLEFKRDFSGYFDTEAERQAAEAAIRAIPYSEMNYDQSTGRYSISPDNVLLPWNNPKTAHIFDVENSLDTDQINTYLEKAGLSGDRAFGDELQRRKDRIAQRENYITANSDPKTQLTYDEWKPAYDNAMTEGIAKGLDGQELIDYVVKGTSVLPEAIKFEGSDVETSDVSPTGYLTSTGLPVRVVEGDAVPYSFKDYKAEHPEDMDLDVIANMADIGGDKDALQYFKDNGTDQELMDFANTITDKSSDVYKQIASNYKTTTNSNFHEGPDGERYIIWDGKLVKAYKLTHTKTNMWGTRYTTGWTLQIAKPDGTLSEPIYKDKK